MQKAHGNSQPTAVYGKCRDSERPDDALQRLKLFTPEPIALIKSDKNLTVCETPVMLSPKRSPAQCESEMTFSYSRTYLRRKGSIQILEDAMRRRSKSTSNSSAQEQSAAERTSKGRPHFRPVRYEVATEIDQIFGSVSKQRENLALRVRDEEGLLWFDEIERQENEILLQATSPGSPFELFSRRSSTTSNILPTSPLDLLSGRVTGDLPILSPTNSYIFECQQKAHVPLQDMTISERRYERNGKPRKGGNEVRCLMDQCRDLEDMRCTDMDIVIPTCLPLPHRNQGKKHFDEAFADLTFRSLAERMDQRGKRRPPHLSLSSDTKRLNRPMSAHGALQGWTSLDTPTLGSCSALAGESLSQTRRRSSVDLSSILNRGPDQAEDMGNNSIWRAPKDVSKAAARLGLTAMNHGLLAPGGLGTGEHVYDGVDIKGASIRLASDDESERVAESSSRRVRRWLRSKKSINFHHHDDIKKSRGSFI